MSVMRSFPMEICNSMVPFIPRDTALYRTYGGLGVSNVNIISGFKMAWSPTIAVLTGHSSYVYCVAFSADGSRLASASEDRTIRLWDGRTGYHIMTLKGHAGPVRSVSFSPRDSDLHQHPRINHTIMGQQNGSPHQHTHGPLWWCLMRDIFSRRFKTCLRVP
jgi:hypothetical protein